MVKKKRIKQELPNRVSELIQLAVKDAKAIERSKTAILNMRIWQVVSLTKNNKCEVCMAGAVMRQTLKLQNKIDKRRLRDEYDKRFVSLHPDDANDLDTQIKLRLIDNIRRGHLRSAIAALSGHKSLGEMDIKLIDQLEVLLKKRLNGGTAPWGVYLKVARELKKVGL